MALVIRLNINSNIFKRTYKFISVLKALRKLNQYVHYLFGRYKQINIHFEWFDFGLSELFKLNVLLH